MATTTRLAERQTVRCKAESSYGVDPTTAATDCIEAYKVDVIEADAEMLRREIASLSLSDFGHVMGAKGFDFKFKTELKGSGAAGTAPEVDALFLAANMAKTTSAGSSVIYDPASLVSAGSVAVEINKDGKLYKCLGGRTNWEINIEAGKFGTIEWTGKSLYATPADASLVTPSGLDTTEPPIIQSASFSLNNGSGFSAELKSMRINYGNEFARIMSCNASQAIKEIRVSDRKCNGNLVFLAPLEAEFTTHATWEAGTKMPFTILCGSSAGNRILITGYCQFRSPKYVTIDGVEYYSIDISIPRSSLESGDDEIRLKYY